MRDLLNIRAHEARFGDFTRMSNVNFRAAETLLRDTIDKTGNTCYNYKSKDAAVYCGSTVKRLRTPNYCREEMRACPRNKTKNDSPMRKRPPR